MPSTNRSTRALLAAFAAIGGFLSFATAQSVATTPVGAVTVSIAAGTGSSRVLTPISFPLLEAKTASGKTIGKIASVTANSITVTDAGWTAGQLSTAATPTLIQITSGSAAGQYFLISTSTQNTATTVTVDAEEAALVNLTTLGIATGVNGDSYRLFECDTLSSLVDNSIAHGAATSAGSDIVQLFVGGSFAQYFMDLNGDWRRIALGNPISNNVPVRPDAIALYNRIANTATSVTLLGDVPNSSRRARIKNSGTTVLSSYWPTNGTLTSLGIQSTPGWVGNASASVADTVSIFSGGSVAQYYYSGTNWRRIALGNPISDTLAIPVGSAVIINKRGVVAGSSALTQTIPYSL